MIGAARAAVLGAAAVASASFDTSERVVDPGFDTPADWTQVRCSVSGSALNFTGQTSPRATGSLTGIPEDGTYRFTATISAWTSGSAFTGSLPGVSATISGIAGPGTFHADVAIAGASAATFAAIGNTGTTMTVDSVSVIRIS